MSASEGRPLPYGGEGERELEELGIAPVSAITFHSLRRTYTSLRCVCGDDIRYTAHQLGHEDPRFTLRVDAQASKEARSLGQTAT